MLKIKDDVDLKELEKFGFISKCGVIYKPKEGERDVIQIEVDPETRILSYPGFSDLFHTREDTTFDLIQAGLVEKVENE